MLALVGEQQLAQRRVDRVAPQRRLVRRHQALLAREQVLEQVDVRAVRHQSAPVTNGPCAAGSPWSTRTAPRWVASSEQMPAASSAARGRELGERLEVGAHLALLEVLGEAQRVLGRPQAREGAAVLRGASARRRRAAEVPDHPLEARGVRPLLRPDRVHLGARVPASAPRGTPRTPRPTRARARAASRAAPRPSPAAGRSRAADRRRRTRRARAPPRRRRAPRAG